MAGQPAWLVLFCQRAPAEEIAQAWLDTLTSEELEEARREPIHATRAFRTIIISNQSPEVREDAGYGWKYTASIMRALDRLLNVALPKFMAVPAGEGAIPELPTAEQKRIRGPKLVIPGDGSPGTLSLWWSDLDGACDVENLRKLGVTHRLNCAKETQGKLTEGGPEGGPSWPLFEVPMYDEFSDDDALRVEWAVQLRQSLEQLRAWRTEGAVVNINCKMGKNRSGATLLVYLCSDCGWDLEKGVQYLRKLNPLACANPHLLMALGDALGVSGRMELCPGAAGQEGGWVCISPPGTPREGEAPPQSFEEIAALAAKQLEVDLATKQLETELD